LIVTESKEGRRIVGRLEAGLDVIEAFTDICKKHSIATGEIRAIGYLNSAQLSTYDAGNKAFQEPREFATATQVLNLTGNVSMFDGDPTVHLQALLLLSSDNTIHGGRLDGGIVHDLEFFIDAVDDFSFVRTKDESGLSPWLQIQGTQMGVDGNISHRTDFLAGRLTPRHRDHNEPIYELRADDQLEHPRLGPCVVVQVPDDDRASIRLDSGRVVDLHMGLVRLERTGTNKKGNQTFRVIMRKRD
jgi:predicted DNA-binding protein with PD1-like motif